MAAQGNAALVPVGTLLEKYRTPPFEDVRMAISGLAATLFKTALEPHQSLDTCWKTFDHEFEKVQNPTQHHPLFVKIAFLRLLAYGLTPAQKEQLRTFAHDLRNSGTPHEPIITPLGWIGCEVTSFSAAKSLPFNDLRKGQLVGVIRSNQKITVGAVISKDSENERVHVVLDREGSRKDVRYETLMFFTLPDGEPPQKPSAIIQEMFYSPLERSEHILSYFDTFQPLTDAQKNLLDRPFPIIWGSTQTVSFKDELHLGSQIQLAFTTPEKVALLQEITQDWGVKVLELEAARFTSSNV